MKPSVKADNERLQAKVAELRVRARTDRNRIRDLSNEVTVLKDDGDPRERAAMAPAEPLRVEVVDPGYDDVAAPPEHEPIALGGYDEDGAEVVYVGEAAVGPSVKISADRYDLEARRSPPRRSPPRRSRRSRAPQKSLPRVPTTGERLGVTGRKLPKVSTVASGSPARPARNAISKPTVDTQLRHARTQRPRARTHSFEDPTVEYERYYAALREGRHAEAVAGFRNFVERFPNHGHADNAQYWLGEAFYDQRQFRSAAVEFKKVADKFPEGNKVPDSLLKLGYCHAQLGENKAAKKALRRVIREFPSSNPAALAARKLERL